MDGWDVRDVLGYLEGRGLRLHLWPSWPGGDASSNAYLTTAARPPAELFWLPKDTKKMDRWVGVVYCERVLRYEERAGAVRSWGDCGLRAGPFVFFGDPALLSRIRAALGDANCPSTRSEDL
jgi:hypothetical protein